MITTRLIAAICVAAVMGCSNDPGSTTPDSGPTDMGSSTSDAGGDISPTEDAAEDSGTEPMPGEPVMVHDFGTQTLPGGTETTPCVQWSFNNSQPLYVNKVTLSNDGAFHHSNWLVVPETSFPGEDGYFDCGERGYSEINAAIQGTVLFAQSTQSREESQDLADGMAVKIPPFAKVIGGLHLLNISTEERETGLRMRIDLLHPRDVEKVVTPFRLGYYDLNIQPDGETRVESECDLATAYEDFTGGPLDMKLHWVLPHYHELGNYFRLDVIGGPQDGETLFELEGFNAEANGQPFAPPVDLTGATGLRFSCGWNNPRDETVGWGLGDQEMCVMLGLVEGAALFDAAVTSGDAETGTDPDGRNMRSGPCTVTMLPKNANQGMPTPEEIDAPLYVPDTAQGPDDVTVVPECVDVPDDVPAKFAPTLSAIHGSIFVPSCAYSSCHDADNPAFDLDLATRDGLHQRLMDHAVQHTTPMPLVEPGDAAGSWLYTIMSDCEPAANVAPMPRNAPNLLEAGLVGTLREWIEAGAADD